MAVQGILFDLDCTLTDRRRSIERAAARLAEVFPACLDQCTREALVEAMWRADHWGYRDRREFFAEVIETIGWRRPAEMDRLLRYWREDYPACTVGVVGLIDLLDRLRRRALRLGIVTNGNSETQNRKIDVLDLRQRVDAVVVSDDVGVKKPDPRIFRLALERLGTEATDTLFVGDHPANDIGGAAGAGMRGVWIEGACAWTDGTAKPWRRIRSVLEMGSLLESP